MSSNNVPDEKKTKSLNLDLQTTSKQPPSKIHSAIETAASVALGSAIGSLITSAFKSFFGSSSNSDPSSTTNKTEKDEVIECEKLKEILLKCLKTNFQECDDIQKEFLECLVKYNSISSK